MNRSILTLGAAALAASSPLTAQPGATGQEEAETMATLSAKAREARLKGDVTNWLHFGTRMLAIMPDHPDVLISVARASAAAGERAKAMTLLPEAVRRGAGLDPPRFAEFKGYSGQQDFEPVSAGARRNLAPVAGAVPFADLGERRSEGIAYDPVSRRFFAGTDHGELVAIAPDGTVSTFASGGGLRQSLGLKVDPKRRLLWVVNGRYPEPGPDTPADSGTGGVRAYDLDTAALVRAVELDERPLLHGFNDMALAADGTVYLTDSATNAVYKLAPGGTRLVLLLRDQGLSFPNGIVLAPGDRTLYVAHAEGISAVDLASGSRRLLAVPADGSVHSIDGLLLHGGVFYGVQPSPFLHRIVAAKLSPDGRSIDRVWTLSSRTPPEYYHSTAAIAGDDLYMIGGNPLPDVYGGTNPAKPVRRIWRVPLKP